MHKEKHCGFCHECQTPLRKILDGEEWCPQCKAYKRYPSHGWSGSGSCPIHFPFAATLVGALPKNWERAFGYQGEQRWLAAFWSPYGDEAYMSDGMMSGTANHLAYFDLEHRFKKAIKRSMLAMSVPIWALGSSDNEATHSLLCDLKTRLIFIAPLAPASHFMRQEYVRNEPQLSDAELEKLWDTMDLIAKRQEKMAFIVCRNCVNGYVPTEEGYEPCTSCDNRGSWFVEVEETHTLKSDEIHIVWPANTQQEFLVNRNHWSHYKKRS